MVEQKVGKVTISLPRSLLDFTDRLAKIRSTTRSGIIAELLKREEEAQTNTLMAEGYRDMGEENLTDAERSLNLTREVVLQNG